MAPRATAAQKAEVTKDADIVQFVYDGETYSAPTEMDLDALEEWEQNHFGLLMMKLVGRPAWREFRRTHSTQDELGDFFIAWSDAAGAKN